MARAASRPAPPDADTSPPEEPPLDIPRLVLLHSLQGERRHRGRSGVGAADVESALLRVTTCRIEAHRDRRAWYRLGTSLTASLAIVVSGGATVDLDACFPQCTASVRGDVGRDTRSSSPALAIVNPVKVPALELKREHRSFGASVGRRRAPAVGQPLPAPRGYPVRQQIQPATIVAASAIRWSFVQGGPIVARGPCRTSSARSASMLTA